MESSCKRAQFFYTTIENLVFNQKRINYEKFKNNFNKHYYYVDDGPSSATGSPNEEVEQ